MPDLKKLRNKSGIAQTVVFNGKPITLDPFEENNYVLPVAELFLSTHAGVIDEVHEDIGAEYTEKRDTSVVWIANVTGNPDAPDTVPVRNFINKRWVDEQIESPIKKPRDLTEWAEGPMVQYIAKDGTPEALNMPGHMVSVPAYRRRKLDRGEGNWFLNRVSYAALKVQGMDLRAARPCRAPSNFEPNSDWPLDDMRGYLYLCDARAVLGPDEAALEEEFGNNETEHHIQLEKAKKLAIKRIYFRIIHPDASPPSRKAFNDFMGTFSKASDKVKEPAKRGPGRPPKQPTA